jgi:hypothetical protein
LLNKEVNPNQGDNMTDCEHDKSNSWWVSDAQGIPLARVCDTCEDKVLSRYRPEILSGYSQSDVDEDIEPDYDWDGYDYGCP